MACRHQFSLNITDFLFSLKESWLPGFDSFCGDIREDYHPPLLFLLVYCPEILFRGLP